MGLKPIFIPANKIATLRRLGEKKLHPATPDPQLIFLPLSTRNPFPFLPSVLSLHQTCTNPLSPLTEALVLNGSTCLKNVVSVEISKLNRNIVRCWWEQTKQRGNLIDLADVQQLNGNRLEQMMSSFGGFDLVVGGSPCNNLADSNRHHRGGLGGKESALFYDYFRILDLVKCIMTKAT